MEDLSSIRTTLRAKRRRLTKSVQKKHAKHLLYQCQKYAVFKNSCTVGLYLPFDGEISTEPIINFLRRQGKQVLLPKINKDKFYFISWQKHRRNNRFGIAEPLGKDRYHPKCVNIIFMPTVAFDQYGNRLGVGAGFYDKTLSFIKKRQYFRRPKLYALAHACQQSAELRPKSWDIKPLAVITECAYIVSTL